MNFTEPDAGSDACGTRTTAVRDGDEWVINGSKCFKGLKVSDAEFDAINLARDTCHGDWNYTIHPKPLDL